MTDKDWHWEGDGEGWIKRVYDDDLVKIDRVIAGKSQEFDAAERAINSLDSPYEREAVSLLVKLGAQISRPHVGMVLSYFKIMREIGRENQISSLRDFLKGNTTADLATGEGYRD
jgi:hypothetical protein